MMQKSCNSIISSETIITVVSWEERFLVGIKKLIKETSCNQVFALYFKEYLHWTNENLESLREYCNLENIQLTCKELEFKRPEIIWNELSKVASEIESKCDTITLDITTMPRETIWQLCYLLDTDERKIQYVYHRPKGYALDWLSRDPAKPRFVIKFSGVSGLERDTALVILTGYDVERTKQLIRVYDPKEVYLGIEEGDQYNNDERNDKKHRKNITRNPDVYWFDIDAYSVDGAFADLCEKIGPLTLRYNVILSCLGPKLGAISAYLLWKKYPMISFAYAPSKEYNYNYSNGYSSSISGILNSEPLPGKTGK